MGHTLGHTLNAILLASLIATDDPHADAWDSVDYHRAMSRDCGAGMVDLLGRPVVDALPGFDVDAFADDADVEADTVPFLRVRVSSEVCS